MNSDDLRKIAKATTPAGRGRLTERADVIDFLKAHGLDEVAEKIEHYIDQLGMTHLIATRLRISGLAKKSLKASVESLAELRLK